MDKINKKVSPDSIFKIIESIFSMSKKDSSQVRNKMFMFLISDTELIK